MIRISLLLFFLLLSTLQAYQVTSEIKRLELIAHSITPLHEKLGKPDPGDWLSNYTERGQSFDEYLKANPRTLREQRRIIYLLPLGNFTRAQQAIIQQTTEFMGIYFNCEVKTQDPLPLSVIPSRARRTRTDLGWIEQILTTYILNDILVPRLPEDAAALIALTASDLWPGEEWNFVFGHASLRQRVGVWSIYRNGDPEGEEKERRLCLLRTLKTAVHETGHMLTMQHCTVWKCNMCGANSQEEADRLGILLCPECLPKLAWACRVDPGERYQKLASFCRREGLTESAKRYEASYAALKAAGLTAPEQRRKP